MYLRDLSCCKSFQDPKLCTRESGCAHTLPFYYKNSVPRAPKVLPQCCEDIIFRSKLASSPTSPGRELKKTTFPKSSPCHHTRPQVLTRERPHRDPPGAGLRDWWLTNGRTTLARSSARQQLAPHPLIHTRLELARLDRSNRYLTSVRGYACLDASSYLFHAPASGGLPLASTIYHTRA